MIRYFMSIPEAAALVIQAGAMATGGDVFVLDMGRAGEDRRPRAGHDPPDGARGARRRASRRRYRHRLHRPAHGEKLYEELLLGENVTPTEHPRILRSREPFVPKAKLEPMLAELAAAMEEDLVAAIKATLGRVVETIARRSTT